MSKKFLKTAKTNFWAKAGIKPASKRVPTVGRFNH